MLANEAPATSFGSLEGLWDLEGKNLHTLADRDLRIVKGPAGGGKGLPKKGGNLPSSADGKRDLGWRPDGKGMSFLQLETAAAEGEKKPEAPKRNPIMEKYDLNKDGKLDEAEREALRKDRTAERIKRFDKNSDGKLDEQEEAAARAEFRKRRTENTPAPKKEQPPAK